VHYARGNQAVRRRAFLMSYRAGCNSPQYRSTHGPAPQKFCIASSLMGAVEEALSRHPASALINLNVRI